MFTKAELNHLWDVAFDAKIWAEDMIHLNANGFPHGYKKGYVEGKLKDAEKALAMLEKAAINL